jgi:hypothetical protein
MDNISNVDNSIKAKRKQTSKQFSKLYVSGQLKSTYLGYSKL